MEMEVVKRTHKIKICHVFHFLSSLSSCKLQYKNTYHQIQAHLVQCMHDEYEATACV